jgi:hypothetical protein
MKNLIACCFFIFVGCSPVFFQPDNPGVDYRWAIERWQKRIQQESWNEDLVGDIIDSCLRFAKYEAEEGDDYWKTYQEFLVDFRGDCEDISVFMYGTLKRLGYSNDMRLRIIRTPRGDHSVLMVQLPEKKWKMYNSTPIPGDFADMAISRTLVEWDEHNIYYP